MEQELLIIIIQRRERYRPDHESGASFEQFLSFILDKAILNLIEARNALKRGKGFRTVSMDQEIDSDDGEFQSISETISDAHHLGGRPPCPFSDMTFFYDAERMFRRLNKEQREIGSLIIKGYTPSEISRLIQKPRTTLHTELHRMGRIMEEDGLSDYFPPKSEVPERIPTKPVEGE
ncbi:MAG: hypothetical protein KCHDKBKB_01692 [Elusimicrobia bacterium]|nr:hypothetical protein [Elusimicrobiota bacterium]